MIALSQLTVSLVVLRILEQGLSKTLFSLADLDDHEKLGYSKILQAVLSDDPRLLTEETWKRAVSDQTTEKGIKIEIPTWKASVPQFTHE